VGIGLGVNLPEYKLDIGGRVRLQHNTTLNQTAGFWFDGTTAGPRSFIGTIDDNHVGIWGNAGAGWNIAMNVSNGNTGIGTSSPTARLDINGSVRFRNANPKTGSVLISSDVNGNAIWESPTAFHAFGVNNLPLPVPANTWTKFYFETIPEYNAGLMYEPINSQFVAPYKGIYHFTGQVTLSFDQTQTQGIVLKLNRFGVISTIATKLLNHGAITVSGTQYNNTNTHSMDISTDVLLEAGDKVWLEVFHADATYSNGYQFYDWFTGTLISRL
jgi:C1q domain